MIFATKEKIMLTMKLYFALNISWLPRQAPWTKWVSHISRLLYQIGEQTENV